MSYLVRCRLLAIVIVWCAVADAVGQQVVPDQSGVPPATAAQQPAQQPAVQPAAAPQVPPGFQLNQLQQAALDAVLNSWQQQSAKVTTFSCPFQRWEYDVVFGPKAKDPSTEIPLYKNLGDLSYNKPDKGSFQITETNKWEEAPAPPGQPPTVEKTGTWVKQPDAVGDHWVCDGKSVYQYRPDLKQLVEHPIPPNLQGQAIADGPLPFLFGAEAKKLKQRYWMKLDPQQNQDPKQIWLIALPKFQEQAADFSEVDVILDTNAMLPLYMRVWMPNHSHHVYIFDTKNATINGPFARLQALFQRPSVPFGWKRVVENMPLQQAAQPVQPPR